MPLRKKVKDGYGDWYDHFVLDTKEWSVYQLIRKVADDAYDKACEDCATTNEEHHERACIDQLHYLHSAEMCRSLKNTLDEEGG